MTADQLVYEFRRSYGSQQRALLLWLAELWGQLEEQARQGGQRRADILTWGFCGS